MKLWFRIENESKIAYIKRIVNLWLYQAYHNILNELEIDIKYPAKSESKWQRTKKLTSLRSNTAKSNPPNIKKGCLQSNACGLKNFDSPRFESYEPGNKESCGRTQASGLWFSVWLVGGVFDRADSDVSKQNESAKCKLVKKSC